MKDRLNSLFFIANALVLIANSFLALYGTFQYKRLINYYNIGDFALGISIFLCILNLLITGKHKFLINFIDKYNLKIEHFTISVLILNCFYIVLFGKELWEYGEIDDEWYIYFVLYTIAFTTCLRIISLISNSRNLTSAIKTKFTRSNKYKNTENAIQPEIIHTEIQQEESLNPLPANKKSKTNERLFSIGLILFSLFFYYQNAARYPNDYSIFELLFVSVFWEVAGTIVFTSIIWFLSGRKYSFLTIFSLVLFLGYIIFDIILVYTNLG